MASLLLNYFPLFYENILYLNGNVALFNIIVDYPSVR